MEALLLLISNYKQDKVSGTCADAARLIEAGNDTSRDRMMYADGFLLPHSAACFQDKSCYPFSCLLIYLKRQSPIVSSATRWAGIYSSYLCLLLRHSPCAVLNIS